ncbi:hypothetical protein BDW22DRAFT_318346 [Trametopsis cervina]|nr:hypothetical protein BDW22DRAFT_318346 [Trametopsis cervina]
MYAHPLPLSRTHVPSPLARPCIDFDFDLDMPGDDLASSLTGPLLLCVCAAILLYGIFLAQTIFYWGTYTKDELRVKLWVVVLSLLETAHTIVCIHVLYYYFVAHYGEYAILEQIVWSSGVSIALEVSIVGLVQGFYVYRIWHITNKSKLITFALLFVITFCIVVGIRTSPPQLLYTHSHTLTIRGRGTVSAALAYVYSVSVFIFVGLTSC